MSETAQQQEECETDGPWREEVNRARVMSDLLGHQGLMLDRINKTSRIQRMGMRALQRGSPVVDPKLDDDPEDDMGGVNIGNEFHIHGQTDKIAQDALAALLPILAGKSQQPQQSDAKADTKTAEPVQQFAPLPAPLPTPIAQQQSGGLGDAVRRYGPWVLGAAASLGAAYAAMRPAPSPVVIEPPPAIVQPDRDTDTRTQIGVEVHNRGD